MVELEIKIINYVLQYLDSDKENITPKKEYTIYKYLDDINFYFKLHLHNIDLELSKNYWIDYDDLKQNYAKFIVKTYLMVIEHDLRDKQKILRMYISQYNWQKKSNPFNYKKEFILL